MKKQEYFMIFDCGATNIKVIALSLHGNVICRVSFPNAPKCETESEGYLIWDFEDMWRKLCLGSRQIITSIGNKVIAVSVITFGADGAPVKEDGSLTYPVISWQCPRTEKLTKDIVKFLSAREIFEITGYQVLPFNTFFKLWWLRKYVPNALNDAKYFLMLPGLLNFKLTGEMTMDCTSASTTMLFDIKNRQWSERLLSLVGLDAQFFPKIVESGEIIGTITEKASKETSIPKGTPVVSAGHDTQFAIIGACAEDNDLVLSSGTWEIAAIRIPFLPASEAAFSSGMIVELDAERGLWNPQMLMVAGGVIEWVRHNFFADCKEDVYEQIIDVASSIPPGAGGICFVPAFMPSGPLKPYGMKGTILGLNLNINRAHIARAVFEGLSFQLRHAVDIISKTFDFRPEKVVVVGGGAKNIFWNRIRADILNLPVIVGPEEAAALGAALFAMVGVKYAKSLKEARAHVARVTQVFEPSPKREVYDTLYAQYIKILGLLMTHYQEGTVT